jgi:hypothetical protein
MMIMFPPLLLLSSPMECILSEAEGSYSCMFRNPIQPFILEFGKFQFQNFAICAFTIDNQHIVVAL